MLRDLLLDALFPVDCLGCHRILRAAAARLGPLCDACRGATIAPPPPLCARCGVPLAPIAAVTTTDVCPACRARPPAFVTARGAALYDPARASSALVTALHALKYRGERALAGALAVLITSRLVIPRRVVIVPVPLHRSRLRARRFNQAALIAHAVAHRMHLPVVPCALVRRVPTPSQTALGAVERRRNLHDAFRVMRPAAIAGRHVLLIDDVITTSATADACARALLRGGARRVDVYAVGRTPFGPHP